jgi:hypothetical protein
MEKQIFGPHAKNKICHASHFIYFAKPIYPCVRARCAKSIPLGRAHAREQADMLAQQHLLQLDMIINTIYDLLILIGGPKNFLQNFFWACILFEQQSTNVVFGS